MKLSVAVPITMEKHQMGNTRITPNVTGVLMEIDPKNTLEAALKLQPDTRNVVVVGGAHKNDRGYEAVVREAFKDYEKKLNITYLAGMPMAEILGKVSTLPKKTIVLFVTMFQDGTGKAFVPRDVSAIISKASNVPVYGLFDSYFGYGIVGGRLVSFEEQGKRAAEIGLEILHGRKPVEIPVVASPNVYKFDWRQLKRWGISERHLPAGSSVAYKEYTLWDRYKWEIVVVGIFLVIQFILISILLVERSVRRKTQIALRESEQKYRSIFENAVEGIFQTTPEGRFLSANPAHALLFGYDSPREFMERITDIGRQHYVDPEDRRTYKNTLQREGVINGFEVQLIKKDGNLIWASINARVVKDDKGDALYYEGTLEDVTARKQAEGSLKASLREKEVLLKEIQHRVKNNLLAITSILALQSERIKDNESKDAFITSMNRINAMTRIHTKLYQSENYSLVRFKGYMEELLGELSRSYGFPHEYMVADIQDISIDVNTAIPVGLIVNELVSNAIKHAFPEGRKGQITITLFSEDSRSILTISDNGIGFSPHVDFRNMESIGFSLLAQLVEQINGTVELLRDEGAQFIITFSVD